MARLFRQPDSGPADARESVQGGGGEVEKHALKTLIERKRKDDHVRRREFNHLRKVRAQSRGGRLAGAEAYERTSVFAASSGFDASDRASTVQKIDAIEAYMVRTWAKAKGAPATLPPVLTERHTAPGALQAEDDLDLDFTALLSQSAALNTASATTVPPELPVAQPAVPEAAPTPKDTPVSPLESALQDAAMRFAEGDSVSAEAVLLGLLQSDEIDADDADRLAFALFDLYRATGQQDGFDVVAMDYAERFCRSPAEWFSLPAMLGELAGTAAVTAPPTPLEMQDPDAVWVCPAVLDEAALAALRARFSGSNSAWTVDWGALTEIEPLAALPLSDLLGYWSAHPVHLHWSSVEALLQALEWHTPPDDDRADPLWWSLRLDALCILQRSDAFESLALDYCVVYEVSPPSWKVAQCTFVQEASHSAFASLDDDQAPALPLDSSGLPAHYVTCELIGMLEGEATAALEGLRTASGTAPQVIVSCELLGRVDFSAASAILNWTAECVSNGSQIQFIQVPHLVAVFFRMLGLDQYAKISVRAN
jgi:ABC-type transporter Mla MlaB component